MRLSGRYSSDPHKITILITAWCAVGFFLVNMMTNSILAVMIDSIFLISVYAFTHRIIVRQQQAKRQQIIFELRLMLMDIIRNDLAVVVMNVGYATELSASRHQRIEDAVTRITDTLDALSLETLTAWKTKYRHILDASTRLQ